MANDSRVRPKEEVLLEINIMNHKRKHWFMVMDDLTANMILGGPFLRKIGAILFFYLI
jgi:hypothetical protein